MATSVNVAKLANVFPQPPLFSGGRWTLMHGLSETYKPAITRNKERLMDLLREKAEAASRSELAKKMRTLKGFYTVEMAPPNLSEIEKIKADVALMQEFFKYKCHLRLTVRQAWLLFLVCTEVFLWFFIGETIGKAHIVGYLV